jgi:uncharacterized membrane protein
VAHLFWLMSANVDGISGWEKLRVVKKIDDLMSVPAWVVTFACGITMWLWTWPLNTSWIVVSLTLGTILTIMGISFGPFMHRWIKLAKEQQPGEPQLARMSKRLTYWWLGIVLTVVLILYLMIWKPTFW